MSIRIRAGESIFYDFIKDGDFPTDTQKAKYKILRGDKLISSGDIDVEDTTFMLRIKSGDTVNLSPGSYSLLVSFEDTETGYLDYILDEALSIT